MPTYDYYCMQCDQDSERLTTIGARDSQFCSECGSRLHRPVTFNGGVWAPTSTSGGMKV